ncbi:unnamed protein product [Paramecium octaurelia]|uniref:Uncharacterized protein n=1 Tax=Paramecium octaurelia TaxID=43137 RepID=A0A8S1WFP5_PAROT|nr:unnamed protein product [Paramecium octaurelia]
MQRDIILIINQVNDYQDRLNRIMRIIQKNNIGKEQKYIIGPSFIPMYKVKPSIHYIN